MIWIQALFRLHCIILFVLLFANEPCYANDLSYAISLYGTPKYPPGFEHFDYVNPNAPKGGTLKLSVIGGFDHFSPYPNHKIAAEGIYLLYDSLLKRSLDEPFTCYPRIANALELGPNEEWVLFHINPQARFHDQNPITSADVQKTIELIQKDGPFTYRHAFQDIEKIEALTPLQIKFYFRSSHMKSLALFIGILPILPAKELEKRDSEKKRTDQIGYETILGNGPYKITKFIPNKFVEYERVSDYWGKDLPCQKGQHNFDLIRFEYFRNYEASFEAFKAGEVHIFEEDDIGHWLKNYNFPAAKKGHVQLRDIPHQRPLVYGFVFNTRRSPFNSLAVRKALSMVMDLEQLNKQYFHNAYEEVTSFFGQTDLSAPQLSSLKAITRKEISDAIALLKQEGFVIRETKLCDKTSGKPIHLEILLQNPQHERLGLFFKNNLEKLGIHANIRLVDSATYQKRITEFDFDVIIHNWQQSLAPEREQLRYWGSESADLKGSANYAGIKDPQIDALLNEMLRAKNREMLVNVVQRLDLMLQKGYYVVPLLQKTRDLIAYWNRFGHPKSQPITAFPLLRWWCVQSWWHERSESLS